MLPKVTDADRAAGFLDLKVNLRDGRAETLRVFKPESLRLLEIWKLPTMTERVFQLNAHCIRRDIAFFENATGAAVCEIFLAANFLSSEEVGRAALLNSREIGWQLICENTPGLCGQLEKPANN